MNVAVSLYGESNGPAGWLWWADVYLAREDQLGWVNSTGSRRTASEAFTDGMRLVRTVVALRPDEGEDACYSDD